MNNEFTTKDLYLAGFLYAKGAKFKGVNREGRICWFIFDDESYCKSCSNQFFSKTADVNARTYADALRTLKDVIFSEAKT